MKWMMILAVVCAMGAGPAKPDLSADQKKLVGKWFAKQDADYPGSFTYIFRADKTYRLQTDAGREREGIVPTATEGEWEVEGGTLTLAPKDGGRLKLSVVWDHAKLVLTLHRDNGTELKRTYIAVEMGLAGDPGKRVTPDDLKGVQIGRLDAMLKKIGLKPLPKNDPRVAPAAVKGLTIYSFGRTEGAEQDIGDAAVDKTGHIVALSYEPVPEMDEKDFLRLNAAKDDKGKIGLAGWELAGNHDGAVVYSQRKFIRVAPNRPVTIEEAFDHPSFDIYDRHCIVKDGKVGEVTAWEKTGEMRG